MAKKSTASGENVIQFPAQVWSIKTTVDGGINVTLALSEKQVKQVSQLLECKQRGALLEVAIVPIERVERKVIDEKAETPKRRKQRYPYRDG